MSQLWGGRFTEAADGTFARFNQSLSFDFRLLPYDIQGSIAYAKALSAVGVMSTAEFEICRTALKDLARRCRDDDRQLRDALAAGVEDVHSFVEAELTKTIGPLAKKLHTGRSRNDQVATDLRLYLRDMLQAIDAKLVRLQARLIDLASEHFEVIIPGYTHLQRAQPLLFSHYLLSFFEMFQRDRDRVADASKRLNVLPLGSGALAGNSWGVDRLALAKELGFAEISRNSVDATSDRDFVTEALFVIAQIGIHLSRLSEDFIIYCTREFGFIKLSDAVSTGSSLMPQKKNPDSLELVRGKTGRLVGNLTSCLVMLKGLPSCYNKDLQEDKEGLFDSIDQVQAALVVTETVLNNIEIVPERMRSAAESGFLNATELADVLVARGTPFREAHHIVGRLVHLAIERGCELAELPTELIEMVAPNLGNDFAYHLRLEATIDSKRSMGGTSSAQVQAALSRAKASLEQARSG